MANRIICVTGLPGSGKSVVSDYLVEKGYQFIRFGQITLDKIKEQNLELNEENERKIREDFREKHGMGAFAILNMPKFKKMIKKNNIVADGMYSFEEYQIMKEAFGSRCIVIAVYASPQLRYQRISKRKMEEDDTDLRNRSFTKEEAASRDYAQLLNLNMGPTIAMADFTLLNTKDKKFLFKQLKEVISEIEQES